MCFTGLKALREVVRRSILVSLFVLRVEPTDMHLKMTGLNIPFYSRQNHSEPRIPNFSTDRDKMIWYILRRLCQRLDETSSRPNDQSRAGSKKWNDIIVGWPFISLDRLVYLPRNGFSDTTKKRIWYTVSSARSDGLGGAHGGVLH